MNPVEMSEVKDQLEKLKEFEDRLRAIEYKVDKIPDKIEMAIQSILPDVIAAYMMEQPLTTDSRQLVI